MKILILLLLCSILLFGCLTKDGTDRYSWGTVNVTDNKTIVCISASSASNSGITCDWDHPVKK